MTRKKQRTPPPQDILSSLSPRERQVADTLLTEYSAAGIARKLGIHHRTAERHLGNIYSKLGINSKVELAIICCALKGHILLMFLSFYFVEIFSNGHGII
jgi:DNA-binding CsgD family transcriptional regulator